ncbi:MAG: hypothetical protein GXP55_07140 [Deltaproteobacteria bacterium]|nr:hypothetical protein [Deltaproteobacteria bacterium]
MSSLQRALLCVATAGLFACGASSPHAGTADDTANVGGTSDDSANADDSASADDSANAGATSDASAPACPASFAEARGGCESGPGTSDCSYPEGECYCGEDRVCSGAVRSPMSPEMYTWQCTPTPPEVREDGCPGMAPDGGSACSLDHSCGYGFCGGPIYSCVHGEWQVTDMVPPPP